MNPYNQNYFGRPNYAYNAYPQMQPMAQSIQQPIQQPIQPIQPTDKSTGLQGKFVDSKDTAKIVEFPFDGSISYFPLIDGSMIITKQLQQDGTTKTIVYEPVIDEKVDGKETPQYVTVNEFNEKIKDLDNTKDLKDEIKNLKKQIKDLTNELEYLKDKED